MSKKSRWDKEKAAVASIQVAFDLGVETQMAIKRQALEEHMSPSDFIRKALGLEYRIRPVRPRLTLSLSDHDFEVLARLWGIDEHDRLRIKEEAALRLIRFANKEESESDND
ncbi:hypothetical protein [Herbaspirillum sp.]|uniref:hypothetical protein n=1 Tax=Herbaspirillum sp. TaxID=1890675 RepID=UPI000C0B16FB|nr:hypothetical protein [Herbaspirillum sp.]MAF02772.1 hypothetical protein [Herbaspirillum sp.]